MYLCFHAYNFCLGAKRITLALTAKFDTFLQTRLSSTLDSVIDRKNFSNPVTLMNEMLQVFLKVLNNALLILKKKD